ncbi:MAG: nucleotide exchange factor GrpE [Lachnospiraceae bacterium]|nr:nucleotide exchange factor GrpE [Lachnospiraceae bacterium]
MNAKDLENQVKKDAVQNAEDAAAVENETVETVDEEIAADTAEDVAAEAAEMEAENSEEAAQEEETTEKKGFFKKKDKKDKKDEKIEELNDRLMRQMAEFDNFRKRSEREKSQMFEIGAKDIVEKILPVIDNMERGLATVSEEEMAANAFAQGMEKVYKQFMTVMEQVGVKPIEALGAEFNPDFHNAVMHVDDETVGENIIVEEFQKGYMYKESVVRHSMVKVAN